jgi:hypothetical protein
MMLSIATSRAFSLRLVGSTEGAIRRISAPRHCPARAGLTYRLVFCSPRMAGTELRVSFVKGHLAARSRAALDD